MIQTGTNPANFIDLKLCDNNGTVFTSTPAEQSFCEDTLKRETKDLIFPDFHSASGNIFNQFATTLSPCDRSLNQWGEQRNDVCDGERLVGGDIEKQSSSTNKTPVTENSAIVSLSDKLSDVSGTVNTQSENKCSPVAKCELKTESEEGFRNKSPYSEIKYSDMCSKDNLPKPEAVGTEYSKPKMEGNINEMKQAPEDFAAKVKIEKDESHTTVDSSSHNKLPIANSSVLDKGKESEKGNEKKSGNSDTSVQKDCGGEGETKEKQNEPSEKSAELENGEIGPVQGTYMPDAAKMAESALGRSFKDDPGIPYDWATELLKNYVPGSIESSAKMAVFFCILEESMALGDRILVFSQSLFTLNLIEDFLQRTNLPGRQETWARNWNYYRLDGSTTALEREKLINEYNSNPNIHLFLVSTRAGSLGINLVGANRVVVFDASWNPCHDTQAVCRVYRYGQKKPCFVYRLVMDNCLEKKIYDRQINKQGMADRVVDECNPDAHLSIKEVTNLCWDNEQDGEVKDFSKEKDKYIDVVMQKILDKHSNVLSKEPFQHESLLVDRKEKKLSQAEKRLAKRSYELEKQANINYSRPQYSYYQGSGGSSSTNLQTGLQIRAIRTEATGGTVPKPVASVRPMQAELSGQLERSQTRSTISTISTGRSRWIPAEVWQRQGMSAQEMTLPLDVVIPTNSPDRASIVLKAGQRVMVLKSPKGIYMQLENGKIIAIRTAFKVGGAGKGAAGQDYKSTAAMQADKAEIESKIADIKKEANLAAQANRNAQKVSSVLPLKNNSAITIIPKGVSPTGGVTGLSGVRTSAARSKGSWGGGGTAGRARPRTQPIATGEARPYFQQKATPSAPTATAKPFFRDGAGNRSQHNSGSSCTPAVVTPVLRESAEEPADGSSSTSNSPSPALELRGMAGSDNQDSICRERDLSFGTSGKGRVCNTGEHASERSSSVSEGDMWRSSHDQHGDRRNMSNNSSTDDVRKAQPQEINTNSGGFISFVTDNNKPNSHQMGEQSVRKPKEDTHCGAVAKAQREEHGTHTGALEHDGERFRASFPTNSTPQVGRQREDYNVQRQSQDREFSEALGIQKGITVRSTRGGDQFESTLNTNEIMEMGRQREDHDNQKTSQTSECFSETAELHRAFTERAKKDERLQNAMSTCDALQIGRRKEDQYMSKRNQDSGCYSESMELPKSFADSVRKDSEVFSGSMNTGNSSQVGMGSFKNYENTFNTAQRPIETKERDTTIDSSIQPAMSDTLAKSFRTEQMRSSLDFQPHLEEQSAMCSGQERNRSSSCHPGESSHKNHLQNSLIENFNEISSQNVHSTTYQSDCKSKESECDDRELKKERAEYVCGKQPQNKQFTANFPSGTQILGDNSPPNKKIRVSKSAQRNLSECTSTYDPEIHMQMRPYGNNQQHMGTTTNFSSNLVTDRQTGSLSISKQRYQNSEHLRPEYSSGESTKPDSTDSIKSNYQQHQPEKSTFHNTDSAKANFTVPGQLKSMYHGTEHTKSNYQGHEMKKPVFKQMESSKMSYQHGDASKSNFQQDITKQSYQSSDQTRQNYSSSESKTTFQSVDTSKSSQDVPAYNSAPYGQYLSNQSYYAGQQQGSSVNVNPFGGSFGEDNRYDRTIQNAQQSMKDGSLRDRPSPAGQMQHMPGRSSHTQQTPVSTMRKDQEMRESKRDTKPSPSSTVDDARSPGAASGTRSGNNSARSTPAPETTPSYANAGTTTTTPMPPAQGPVVSATTQNFQPYSGHQNPYEAYPGAANCRYSGPGTTPDPFGYATTGLRPSGPTSTYGGPGTTYTGYPATRYGATDYTSASAYSAFHRPEPQRFPTDMGPAFPAPPPPQPPQASTFALGTHQRAAGTDTSSTAGGFYAQNVYGPTTYGPRPSYPGPDPAYYGGPATPGFGPFLNHHLHQHPYATMQPPPTGTQGPGTGSTH